MKQFFKSTAFLSLLASASSVFGATIVSYHDSANPNTSPPVNHTTGTGNGTFALVDFSTGLPTGVVLTVAGGSSVSDNTGVTGVGNGDAKVLFSDVAPSINYGGVTYQNIKTEPMTFTFSGLTLGQAYDVAFFVDRNAGSNGTPSATSGSRETVFTLQGATSFTNSSSIGLTRTNGGASTQIRGGYNPAGDLVRYTSIVPTGTSFTIEALGIATNSDGYYGANAIRLGAADAISLAAIPEPSTTLLLGGALLSFLGFRRRL